MMTTITRARPRPGSGAQQGLTIVELMVAVLLAGILVGGLFYMMSGQQATYGQQMSTNTLQQNLWGTMTYLQRWVRQAGYGFGGCPGAAAEMWDGGAGRKLSPIVALRVHNNCDLRQTPPDACPDGTGSDSLTITGVHPGEMATQSMPSMLLHQTMTESVGAASELLLDPATATMSQFAPKDLALLWNPAGGPCVLLEVTEVSGNELVHAAGGLYNAPANILPPGGFPGPQITRVVRIGPQSQPRHFVVDRANRRLLTWSTMNPIPKDHQGNLEIVGDNIEDMQLSFACDVDNDGQLEEGDTDGQRKADEWAHNIDGDLPPACGAMAIGAVRVTLVGRSVSPVPGNKTGFRPAVEDRLAGTVAQDEAGSGGMGTYARAVLTTTIRTMNLR